MADQTHSGVGESDISHVTAGIASDKLYLGRPGVVADLIRSFLDIYFGTLCQVANDELPGEEAEDKIREKPVRSLSFWLAETRRHTPQSPDGMVPLWPDIYLRTRMREFGLTWTRPILSASLASTF